MLEVADVCPRCGQDHPEPRMSFRPRAPVDCPKVVLGSFPVLPTFDPELEELPPSPASRRIQEFERTARTPAPDPPATSAWTRREDDNHSRPIAIPWLPLPDLGEVL